MEMPPSRFLFLAIHFVNGPKENMVLPETMNWGLIRRLGRQPSLPLLVHGSSCTLGDVPGIWVSLDWPA
jgi:hypothetical protein